MKAYKKIVATLLSACMLVSMAACGGEEKPTDTQAANTQASGETAAQPTAGEQPGGSDSQAKKDNWLTAISTRDNGSLDMYTAAINRWGKAQVGPFLQTLWQYDANLKLEGVLAESFEYDDDLMGITVHLRDGVTWHNGDKFTSADVVYTMSKLAAGPAGPNYNYIDYENVEAVDELTVHFGLTRKMGVFEHRSSDLFMYCKSFEEGTNTKDADGNELVACGTGPFIVTEYEKDDHVSYRRNDNYWGEKAKLDGMTMRFIGEASTAFMEVQTGNAQISNNTAASDLSDVQAGNYENIIASDDAKMAHNAIGMNQHNPYFTDVRVRQAVNYAINRKEIFDVAYEGVGSQAWSCISVDVFGFNEEYLNNYPYEYDLEKAKSLMQEAGYADGFTCSFAIENNTLQKTTAELVQAYLAEIGITVTIDMYESAALNELIPTENWGLAFATYNQNGDPSSALTFGTSIRNVGGSNKYNNDKDPIAVQYTELLESSECLGTEEERLAVYKQMQELYFSTIWEVPIADQSVYMVQSTDIEGYWGAGVQPHFENISFK
ncbi:ABC transporter substrate-binding protein [Hominifimenecus sp. rT4P-3]|uniref:ABC transporter substrate-binding protein n=1 Tax=Hominifimenecus sp. rT4P-3 TaxID=3242979 RepID=UPI003DA32D77